MPSSQNRVKHSLGTRLFAYLQTMRPANIVTAFADILAGFAVAGGVIAFRDGISAYPDGLVWLLLATFGLYGGGVVFNDYFDAELDARERPERPIPSGRASRTGVGILGVLLFFFGWSAAFQVNAYSLVLAVLITAGSLVYDRWAKHSTLWGPLLMGLLRGWNLLLGCSIVPIAMLMEWYLPFIPIAYIASITLISQGEVHGGSRKSGLSSLGLIILVTGALIVLGLHSSYEFMVAVPFVILFAAAVFPPFLKAALNPNPAFIRQAVKRGVICLILLNSALAAGFGGFFLGLFVAMLLPVSAGLAKIFAVT
ncbi:UbiA-like protein EboC [Halalkalibaculum sp. DA3122]|uniref:UbiA-like protein EboC n=1 Tax=Halalkalibaculum sp. DA3122 TaxID=3373607 RepID=UPI003754086E